MERKNIGYGLCLLVMVSTLFACMAGGTSGTGMPFGSIDSQGRDTGILYANISGVVVDARGKAAPGIIVVAETSKNSEEAATDYVGNFSMLVVAEKGEQIRFQFKSARGKQWKGTYDSQRLRDGDELSIQLRKDGRASVNLFR